MGQYEWQQRCFQWCDYKPTPEQWKIHRDTHRKKLICGGVRGGKAVDINTPIPTPDGWRTMADIKAGDYVYSDDGLPTRVAWVSDIQYDHKCYKVTFDTGEEVIADAEHLWTVQTEKDRKNANRRKVNQVEFKVAPADRIGERKYRVLTTEELILNGVLNQSRAKWGSGYTSNYSIACVLPVKYQEKELPIHPYLLGAWLGDGDSGAGSITIADSDIAVRIKELGYNIYAMKSRKYGHMVEGLHSLLRINNLKKNKHIPWTYLQSSVEQRFELLRGLLDTDGSATYKGNEFYNNNERLIDSVRELLSSLGIKNWKRSKMSKLYGKECGLTYTVTFSTPISVFHVTRKKEAQVKHPICHTRNHYIRSMEPVSSVPVKCISVESPSSMYLIDNYIPTHNSHSGAMEMVSRVPEGKLYWLVGHDYEATRGEWEHLCVMLDKVGFISGEPSTGIDPGLIRLVNGGKIITKSAKYPRTLATVAPDGIILCEAAQTDYETYMRLDERIAEKRAWLYMSGTLEYSEDWYSEFFNLWQSPNEDGASFSLPTWKNLAKFKGGRNDEEILRIERNTTPDRFQERYGGVPCPPSNRIVKEFRNKIHVHPDIVYDPDYPVEIAIDPGYNGACSVLALQKLGESVIVFDEIYLQGFVQEQIVRIVMQKPWWSLVLRGTIDIAGKAHHSMPAPIEVWKDLAKISLTYNKVPEEDGIDVLRTYMMVNPVSEQPIITINPKCKGIISEFGGCKSPVEDGGTWKRSEITGMPIDKNNHSAKALIYWLVYTFGYGERRRRVVKRNSNYKITARKRQET